MLSVGVPIIVAHAVCLSPNVFQFFTEFFTYFQRELKPLYEKEIIFYLFVLIIVEVTVCKELDYTSTVANKLTNELTQKTNKL